MAESLYFCYLDETGADGKSPPGAPIFALAGFVVPAGEVGRMTREFVAAKRAYDPNRFKGVPVLESVQGEVKGHKLFRVLAEEIGKRQAPAAVFLRETLDIVARLGGGLVGRFWVKPKPEGERFNINAVYASSVAAIAGDFQRFLSARRARGVMWCDSRRHPGQPEAKPNVPVSHAVFVQKFGDKDALPGVLESPAFVDSKNHAGIQIADLLCSALIGPIAAAHYRAESRRADPRALELRDRDGFGERMNKMQLRVRDDSGVVRGALTSGDLRSSAPLFQRA